MQFLLSFTEFKGPREEYRCHAHSTWTHLRKLRIFFFMTRETRSRYPLGAHKVKTPLLCNSSQTTQAR
uniref:Putative ovule protein n=1 Tax=Solanum chacoense TaxID=4108 RepID=A0A0V0IB49_SOLCH